MGLLTAAGGRADAACEIDLPSVCPGEPYGSGGSDTTCDALCIDVAPGAPVTLRCDLGARRDHDLGAHARAFGADSRRLAFDLLERAHVAVTPGIDFGTAGEGFLRFCYAASESDLELALERIGRALDVR